MNLSKRLSDLRKENRMSQIELAERLHTSRQSISKWETGVSLPSIENLISLSQIYKITLDEIIDGTENVRQQSIEERLEDCSEIQIAPAQVSSTDPAQPLLGKRKKILIGIVVAFIVICCSVVIFFSVQKNDSEQLEDDIVYNCIYGL